MSVRDRVLDAFQQIALDGRAAPSLDAIAAAAGVSKGGLLHHFPDRASLVRALIMRAVERTDVVMQEAAAARTAARTWLRLSAAAGPDRETALAVLSLLRLTGAEGVQLPPEVTDAIGRWQDLIVDELGDPIRGDVVRLVGDGLFLETLTRTAPDPGRIDRLVEHVLGRR
jgi:AcrR family transcriptional regulator